MVSALERAQSEVKAGRKYIDALRDQVKSKENLIDKLNERDETRVKVQASLEAEIVELKAAIESQKKELQIKQAEVDYLKTQLSKANKKLRNSHTREKVFAGVAAVLAAILILK